MQYIITQWHYGYSCTPYTSTPTAGKGLLRMDSELVPDRERRTKPRICSISIVDFPRCFYSLYPLIPTAIEHVVRRLDLLQCLGTPTNQSPAHNVHSFRIMSKILGYPHRCHMRWNLIHVLRAHNWYLPGKDVENVKIDRKCPHLKSKPHNVIRFMRMRQSISASACVNHYWIINSISTF